MQGMFSFQDMVFSMSVAVYVAVSIAVAAVRWGHRCEPYAKYSDYYYPAWKALVFCFLSNILFLPSAFLPAAPDSVLQVRLMFILASPFLCALMMFSYFGKALKISWWKKPVYGLSVTFILMCVTATVLVLVPGTQLMGSFGRWFFSAAGMLAILYLGFFSAALYMIARAIRRSSEENYSNPEDFPRQYALNALWISIMHVVVSWTASYIGSKILLSVALAVLSVLAVILLIGVLPPHRSKDVEQMEAGEEPLHLQIEVPSQTGTLEEETLPAERQEDILRAIRHFVEDEKAYLDSHLTLASLSRNIGYNRTYVSKVMSERLDGFFVYVNRCRLAHAARLKVEQPGIPVADLIAASGFGSRQTYYNVRRQLEKE